MTRKTPIRRINRLAPHQQIKGSGYNWEIASVAFSDITERKTKGQKARDKRKVE